MSAIPTYKGLTTEGSFYIFYRLEKRCAIVSLCVLTLAVGVSKHL